MCNQCCRHLTRPVTHEGSALRAAQNDSCGSLADSRRHFDGVDQPETNGGSVSADNRRVQCTDNDDHDDRTSATDLTRAELVVGAMAPYGQSVTLV